MSPELYDFDIYPKVFLTEKEQNITIHAFQALGKKIKSEETYHILVLEVERADERSYPGSGGVAFDDCVSADEKGDLHFFLTCKNEGMYFVYVNDVNGNRITMLRVYALESDMAGRYPLRGDLHMHTCRSDGHETPAVVCANYREAGYDFTVISDHGRYYPSLEAREIYRIDENDESDITNLLVVAGEEIHLPLNTAHYINFGGRFSVNGLLEGTGNFEKGDDKKYRCQKGDCPDVLTRDEFDKMIRERAKSVPLEIESERLSYATLCWEYEMIQKADGLGIFPHPYWLFPTMHVSEKFTRYIYETKPFDAFEVLGGEAYYQHNGFQTAFYYDMKEKGVDRPVVGSTDSHGSTENNPTATLCSTIVFADKNKTQNIIDAVKSKYSVAVDTISKEYRMVGDFRWVKYGSFLMENWYPLHDRACKAEGYYMNRFADGDTDAENILRNLKPEADKLVKKYFNI